MQLRAVLVPGDGDIHFGKLQGIIYTKIKLASNHPLSSEISLRSP